jgi:HD-GYP domain-containing protein (c-di-GMP phosphodiesterase class II)
MPLLRKKARVSIRVAVVSIFALASALTAILAISLQYRFGHTLATEAASILYTTAAVGAAQELRSVGVQTRNMVELLVEYPEIFDGASKGAKIRTFTTALQQNSLFYGIHLGRADGTFFQVVNLKGREAIRKELWAIPEDRWIVVTMGGDLADGLRNYDYLDENLVLRSTRIEKVLYDVASRPWYSSAMSSDTVQSTNVYAFAKGKALGQTISKRVPGTNLVLGIDMTLSSISGYLHSQLSNSDGQSYIYRENNQVLVDSEHFNRNRQEGASSAESSFATVPNPALLEMATDTILQGKMVPVTHADKPYFAYVTPLAVVGDKTSFFGILVPADEVTGLFMERVWLSIKITTGFLLLLIPVSWFFASLIVRPIRKLADENDKIRLHNYDAVKRVGTWVKEVDELSESLISMVIAIQAHELQQRELMDSFIQLIAQAIDDKSHYTGGHCARVPELAFMLAEQASSSNADAFSDFSLDTDDEWREYRIAAWLHDCGKITTPEHIVDKGTKLETIYNRIHEVRMRFEVLLRDAQINYLEKLFESPEQKEILSEAFVSQRAQLVEDFSFVAECNVGGEFLDETKLVRLRKLSEVTWQRNFDDGLGLSPVEELRSMGVGNELPVTEALLSDKPEHIIERTHSTDYAPELGIDIDVPEHLYNLGEIYNLSISRGTLTAEDRFKINEHMISTIKMLEGLPFPEELKNVPRYASTHHETMKGSGYPRKLAGDQLSIPERILAVADVFEALTAADRPYKKAKPVSVAIDILHKMVLDQHLDKDCFELFIRSKVYLKYAEQYLSEGQIDEVAEEKYLA